VSRTTQNYRSVGVQNYRTTRSVETLAAERDARLLDLLELLNRDR